MLRWRSAFMSTPDDSNSLTDGHRYFNLCGNPSGNRQASTLLKVRMNGQIGWFGPGEIATV